MNLPFDLPLTGVERAAVAELLDRARDRRCPGLVRALLFGSRARGDDDAESDLDILLVFAMDERQRARVARQVAQATRLVAARTGVPLQSWTLCIEDLAPGRRTPMLADAIADGLPLWPPHAPPLRLGFTPADARFCAERLLEWIAEGGFVARRALARGRRAAAATRIRDDITRMATAALLVTGDTRHRRVSSLARFRVRLLGVDGLSLACVPALDWAAAAFPPDNGRGKHQPPVAASAAATAELGYALAAAMEDQVVPWILRRLQRPTSPAASPPLPLPPARRSAPTRS